jgi:phosphate transport system substrate-binding protein
MKTWFGAAALLVACQQNATPSADTKTETKAATPAAAPAATAQASGGRDYVSIVGSSTVYPFSTVVAEQLSKQGTFKAPKVESTGTGGGIKLFCEGVGVKFPDIANASRKIKASEIEQCAKNGVKDIVEIKIGYDGIVLANSKKSPELDLTLKEVYLALAKNVPDPKDETKTIANPYVNWSDINAQLPKKKIEVLGPPPTSGTRDAFVELAMDGGCNAFASIKAKKDSDAAGHKALCQTIREDGSFIEAGENDNLIVQKLEANPNALGIFGFSFLEENADKVRGGKIASVAPTFESISKGTYPISRPLFIYVKSAHAEVIPGLKAYLAEFTNARAWGAEGYLSEKGMIPLPDDERTKYQEIAAKLTPMAPAPAAAAPAAAAPTAPAAH